MFAHTSEYDITVSFFLVTHRPRAARLQFITVADGFKLPYVAWMATFHNLHGVPLTMTQQFPTLLRVCGTIQCRGQATIITPGKKYNRGRGGQKLCPATSTSYQADS